MGPEVAAAVTSRPVQVQDEYLAHIESIKKLWKETEGAYPQ